MCLFWFPPDSSYVFFLSDNSSQCTMLKCIVTIELQNVERLTSLQVCADQSNKTCSSLKIFPNKCIVADAK